MKVTIFGSGYVGLVTGACLADAGNDIVCVDVDEQKIAALKSGKVPIYEPGLEEIIEKNIASERLCFTTDINKGVEHGLFQFIAVGTPPDEDGSADLQYVLAVAKSIAENMDEYRIIVNKSTVPVGTADKVSKEIAEMLNKRQQAVAYDVVSNPEFLKEGAAIDDFMKPDRIIVGTDNVRTAELLKTLYAPFNRNHDRLIVMDVRSAELTKYAANAMLATKISFMNELSNIAERTGADIEKVRIGIGSDPRIGYHFIYPGAGYGGSCFPKDVTALAKTAEMNDHEPILLRGVEEVNRRQKLALFQKIQQHFNHDLEGKTFALWGLAFKPNTDDMRAASSRVLMESLWESGAGVRAYDPKAMAETARIYPNQEKLVLCDTIDATLEGANALVIVTEWNVFRSPDFDKMSKVLSEPVIFDGRNIYDPVVLEENGFVYYSIGRQAIRN